MKHYFWAIIWALLVLVFISIPISNVSDSSRFFVGMDKLVHTGFFFVFTILIFYGSIMNHNDSTFLRHLTLLGIASVFAISTELIQKFMFTYRGFEYWDIFADHVGIGMGYFAYLILIFTVRKIKG